MTHPQTTSYCYLNGIIMPQNDANISVDDRGFQFGDGLFETIRIIKGKPYRLGWHIERLQDGLRALRFPLFAVDFLSIITQLLAKNQTHEGILKLMVTRGNGSAGYLPTGRTPTVYATIRALPEPKSSVSLTVSAYRKPAPSCFPTHCKTLQGLPSVLARISAEDDALLLSSIGDYVSECSSSNIFWIKDGVTLTPSLATGALAGIVRRFIIEYPSFMAGNEQSESRSGGGLGVRPTSTIFQGEYSLEKLLNADEVFITNIAQGIVPVVSLGDRTWGIGSHTTAWQKRWQDDLDAA